MTATIDSSLLYVGGDERQHFTHDSYRDFFLARKLRTSLAENDPEPLNRDKMPLRVLDMLVDSQPNIGQLYEWIYFTRQSPHYKAGWLGGNCITILARLGEDLRGKDFSGTNLQGADLSNRNLEQLVLRNCNLRNTNFDFSNMSKVIMEGADTTGVSAAPIDKWEILYVSPEGDTIYFWDEKSTLFIWDNKNDRETGRFNLREYIPSGHDLGSSRWGSKIRPAIDYVSSRIALVSSGKIIFVDILSKRVVSRCELNENASDTQIAFVPQSHYALAGYLGSNGIFVDTIDILSGKINASRTIYNERSDGTVFDSMLVSPNGRYILVSYNRDWERDVVYQDESCCDIFRLVNGCLLRLPASPPPDRSAMAFMHGSDRVVFARAGLRGDDGVIFDPEGSEKPLPNLNLTQPWHITISPDNRTIVHSATRADTTPQDYQTYFRFYEIETGRVDWVGAEDGPIEEIFLTTGNKMFYATKKGISICKVDYDKHSVDLMKSIGAISFNPNPRTKN